MDFSELRESLQEVGEPPKKVCAVCLAPAEKSCPDCHRVFYYCSIEHEMSHWKVHKKDCPPIRIVSSPELGPHFVATRDLPPWTLILTELPVLVKPIVNFQNRPVSCISCRSILSAPCPCPKCSTPFFCNQSCSMNKVHTEFECVVLSKCNVEQRKILCKPPSLMYLKAIHLKNKDPESWSKVLELRGADQYKPGDENDKWFIREILPLLGEKGLGFEGDMAKLQGIIKQRAIMLCPSGLSPEEDHGKFKCKLLYLNGSKLTQNCFPNCTPIIDKGPEFKLELRTTVEVKKGQILSIDFLGLHCDIGAIALQHFFHSGGDLCICPRCSDPTELGTMLSAVKCEEPNCEEGYLLPVDPMNMADGAPWRCNRFECKGKGSFWRKIDAITYNLKDDIDTFQEQVPIEDVVQTREFLDDLKEILHPSHYIVLRFERELVYELNSQMMNQEMEFSLPRLNLHISMIEHLLKMAEIRDPGLSRGILLKLLFNGLKNIVLKVPDFKKRSVQMRTAMVIEKLLPIAKCYSDTWTLSEIQSLIDGGHPFLHINI